MNRFPSFVRGSVLVLCLFGVFSLHARAATVIHVPADQATIQAAINVAVNGDTVLVAPGTYYEAIDFMGKNITVTSSGGPGVTVIDAFGSNRSTVAFQNNETAAAVLSGFTLQDGAEIDIYNASPTIQGNVVLGTFATGDSNYAIRISGGKSQIIGNLIYGGTTTVYIGSDTGVQLIGNIISGPNSYYGSVYLDFFGPLLIKQNAIFGSSTGIYINAVGISPANVIQNLISAPTAVLRSYNDSAAIPLLFANNTMTGSNGTVAIYPADGSTFQNNIIVSTSTSAALGYGFNGGTWGAFTNNDVFSYTGQAYGGPDETGTNGNISADPQFNNVLGNDFHLLGTSPAIGAGTTSVPGLPKTDMDGDPRIIANRMDIGADEYKKLTGTVVSPYVLHFAAQLAGTTSAPQTVTLTNNTTTPTAIKLIASGPNYTQTNNCGTSLASGASCQIQVVFAPLGYTPDTVMGIFTDATLNPEAITLIGDAVVPTYTLNPCCGLNFIQAVGTTSAPQAATLTNTGTVPMLISSISYSGPSDFTQTTNCPIAPNGIAAGGSCTFTVTYAPTVSGNDQGQIVVNNNTGSPATIYLSGNSVSNGVGTFTPLNMGFSATMVGQSSAPQAAVLANTGSGPLGIYSIYAGGPFSETDNCPLLPKTLAVGAKCKLQVTFTPYNQGNVNDSITVGTDGVSNATLNLFGAGVGAVPVINSLLPANFAVGTGNGNRVYFEVDGTGFTPNSQIVWNGTPQQTYQNSTSAIYAFLPATYFSAAATAQVTVTTPAPGGGTSNAVPVTIYPPLGYSSISIPYKYTNITGTNLLQGAGNTAVINSPFPIQYGGGSFSQIEVSTSGVMTLDGNVYLNNENLLPDQYDTTIIAPFWTTDLYGSGSATSTNNAVFWGVKGTAPYRELIVEWRNMGVCCETTATVRFEAIFFEHNSNVQFNYADAVFGGQYKQYDNGAASAVGLQVSPTMANQFSYNQPNVMSQTSSLWYQSKAMLSTSTLGFGYHQIGSATGPKVIKLSNPSTGPMAIAGISTNNPDFTETNTCGTGLAAGAHCEITLTFSPSVLGAENATLTVNSNVQTPTPLTVALSGIGTDTAIVIYPEVLNFGTVKVGGTATAQVTLANAANSKLTVQSVAAAPAAFGETNNCPAVLTPGQSCTTTVSFTPKQAGTQSGTLSMGLNGLGAKVRTTLTGTGQ